MSQLGAWAVRCWEQRLGDVAVNTKPSSEALMSTLD
jgi:hypothetical protein